MYATASHQHQSAIQVRWLARMTAVCLVALWTALVVAEFFRAGNSQWSADLFAQGGILAVVFAGYVIGWRKEMIGGWMAILGTAMFALVLAVTQNLPYQAGQLAWFAVPGVLYLMARHYDRRSAQSPP